MARADFMSFDRYQGLANASADNSRAAGGTRTAVAVICILA